MLQYIWLWEYHPLVWQIPIAVSLSTLPISLDVNTVSCGVSPEGLAKEHPEPSDILSKLYSPVLSSKPQGELVICSMYLISLKCFIFACSLLGYVISFTYLKGFEHCFLQYSPSLCVDFRIVQSSLLSSNCFGLGSSIWIGGLSQPYISSDSG